MFLTVNLEIKITNVFKAKILKKKYLKQNKSKTGQGGQ